MTSSQYAQECARFKMTLDEAYAVIERLGAYKGHIMQPFNSPVNDFLVMPADRQQLLDMLDAMTTQDQSFEKAIAPYKDNVVVLICPAVRGVDDQLNHCSLGTFLELNDIDPAGILGHGLTGFKKRA